MREIQDYGIPVRIVIGITTLDKTTHIIYFGKFTHIISNTL